MCWVVAATSWRRISTQVLLQAMSISERVWDQETGKVLSWAHLRPSLVTPRHNWGRPRGKRLKFCLDRWGLELIKSQLTIWIHFNLSVNEGWENLVIDKSFHFPSKPLYDVGRFLSPFLCVKTKRNGVL